MVAELVNLAALPQSHNQGEISNTALSSSTNAVALTPSGRLAQAFATSTRQGARPALLSATASEGQGQLSHPYELRPILPPATSNMSQGRG